MTGAVWEPKRERALPKFTVLRLALPLRCIAAIFDVNVLIGCCKALLGGEIQ